VRRNTNASPPALIWHFGQLPQRQWPPSPPPFCGALPQICTPLVHFSRSQRQRVERRRQSFYLLDSLPRLPSDASFCSPPLGVNRSLGLRAARKAGRALRREEPHARERLHVLSFVAGDHGADTGCRAHHNRRAGTPCWGPCCPKHGS